MQLIEEIQGKVDSFPAAVSAHRQKVGRTIASCERATGISDAAISRFFKNQSKSPNFYAVMTLCHYLEFPVKEYFWGEDSDLPKTDAELQVKLLEAEVLHCHATEKDLRENLAELKQANCRMFWMNVLLMVAFVIIFVICDLINPYFGFIRRV